MKNITVTGVLISSNRCVPRRAPQSILLCSITVFYFNLCYWEPWQWGDVGLLVVTGDLDVDREHQSS
jgi:hypothetical protein